MVKAKRDKAPKDTRKPKHSGDANRANKQSKNGLRDASTARGGCHGGLPVAAARAVRRLEMYKSRAKRDKKGRIISREFQSKELPSTRIQPDRRWFGNTRVIGQKQLEAFREEMGAKVADPYAVCSVAPIPGETKVWQYITLMKRIFLIDCPGVVYNKTDDSQSDIVLKGVVRVENLEDATEHVGPVLERVKPEYLRRAYKAASWSGVEDFLGQVARQTGKLGKGGEPDLNTAARMVLYDWQRGKIPFFTLPPGHTDEKPGRGGDADGDAAAAAAAAAEGGQAAPLAAEAVTEEDAKAAVDGDPEKAAAAARALAADAAAAAAKQRRLAIPVQQGFFTPADAGEEEEGEEEGAGYESDVISSGSEEEEEEEEEEGSPRGPGDSASSGEGESGDEEDGDGSSEQASGSGSSEDEDDEDEDDAGYDDQELSWEAVMAVMQGGAPAQEDEDGGEGAAAAAVAGSKRKRKQR
ncbi:hypothetical protein CHLNCDRAFT_134718 [Chlorella variabilis]|uniref:Nuclear/nucleolar GTPase 2 n=1 Tax=Chlorella variabilis TaxID=554065 RepID=E1ZGL5_CHLVA|nr:hypothetical protein CHLNCDRAFT_134718 [Chlorella variabilis]EFN54955.1 hypothetical protein CHLNCDRAFT_134718 [Chlorella variabilis]|eukprot:XP_005847057.1 hypothetical protein CHLNCDRAFT_134718 [Chlorella variabilis]